ncbi:histone-lysine N-methyltransferase EHMT2-like [Camarhynchus parvulus]|uniref:histone-lysine N-methyltransferase EHMT2-like n=1 Tax=Geospiza parvula TaxID=87175 RepID=UPI0012381DF6|nr:histone-lysine N-methyltransferase EHMT2-like [Camarhynchus parvulus]
MYWGALGSTGGLRTPPQPSPSPAQSEGEFGVHNPAVPRRAPQRAAPGVRRRWKESPWLKPSRKRKRKDPRGGKDRGPPGAPSEYTEVPLGCLQLPGGGALSPPPPGPAEAERFEELPLCSCRMEAPKVERGGDRGLCMATESVDGQLSGCGSSILKRETMRPSSRVPLMVLCESHRARMVKHQCCPGCGHFCTAGTFLECHPDVRIGHRFHRSCVSRLGGLIFCPQTP